MGDRKTWINYQSGIEEEIENLRSKETKMKLLSECFDEETRKGLAEDPNFLIELGKASVKESQELTDKTIVDFLINKYIENENELQK